MWEIPSPSPLYVHNAATGRVLHSTGFSLNREMLQGAFDSTIAFSDVDVSQGLVPAITLFAGERARMNLGHSEEPLLCSYTSLNFQPVCNPNSLHYNIPLWYSAPGDYDVIDSTHPLLYEKRVVGINVNQVSLIEIYCRQLDIAKQECLRLNFGVTISSNQEDLDLFLPSSAKEKVTFQGLTSEQQENVAVVSYSIVVPAGQNPHRVFVGWTTAGFRYIKSQFQHEQETQGRIPDVQYGQQVKVVNQPGELESVSTYSTAFMVCLGKLLPSPVPPRLSMPTK